MNEIPTLHRMHILASILATFMCALPLLAKNDVIMMRNGDRLVGEIKGMDQGILQLKTDYSKVDFQIEWKKIKYIHSRHFFVIVLSNGYRYVGSLRTDSTDTSRIVIQEARAAYTAHFLDVVYIKPLKRTFKDRLNANFDLGYSLTKANKTQQLNLSGTIGYMTRSWMSSLNFNSITNIQENAPRSLSSDADINYQRFLTLNWFAIVSGTFRSSDEQQLDLRTTLNVGGGKYLVQTNQLYFMVAGGAALMTEKFKGEEFPSNRSMEGLLLTELNAFDTGDLDMFARLTAYPNLSETDRWRIVFNTNLKWKFPYDFYFKLSYTHNFDSKPPNEASKSDYSITTSVGWKF